MPSNGEEHIAGTFSLEVLDTNGELVSGGATSFEVSSCPTGFFFYSPTGECKGCPSGARCPGGRVLPIPVPGYWSELEGYAELGEVFECVHRANCRGGAMYSDSCWENQTTVTTCAIDLCSATSLGPRCGRCKFQEDPRSYMRDDTVCEKCKGTEGPAIIAASIVVPIVVVGVPLIVMRLERARVYAYCLYNRWFDIGKFKVVWVNVRSRARRHLACARA